MRGLTNKPYKEMAAATYRLVIISRKDQKIRKLAISAKSKSDSVWERLMSISNKKGGKGRRQMERPVEFNVSMHTSPPMVEVGKKNGDWSKKMPVEQNNKRNTVSLLEDRKVDRMKRAKRGDTSYAGICKERERDEDDPRDRETCDSEGE